IALLATAHVRDSPLVVLVALMARRRFRRPRRRLTRAALDQLFAIDESRRHLRVRLPAHVDHGFHAAAVQRVVVERRLAVAARLARARVLIEALASNIVADGKIEAVAGAHAQRPVARGVLWPAVVAVAASVVHALAPTAEAEVPRRRLDGALGAFGRAPA